MHVEDCPICAAALGGVRRGALVIVPPVEALAIESTTHAFSHLVENVTMRFSGAAHRVAETVATMPPSGRTAAAVAVAASAMAGSAVTVTKAPFAGSGGKDRPAASQRAADRRAAPTPAPTPALTPPVSATPATTPLPPAQAAPAPTATPAPERRRESFAPTPAPTVAATRDEPTFERQAPAPVTPPPTAPPPAAPAPPQPSRDFGFERG